jgi:hypothetical protein
MDKPAQHLQDFDRNSREAFARKYAEKLLAEARKSAEFARSATFQQMADAIRAAEHPVSVSSDDLSYSLEEAKARVGWSAFSTEDVILFAEIISNPFAATVDAHTRSSDATCSFDNYAFEHFGLHVWAMFGQGTYFSLCNEAAARERDSA